MTRILAFLAVLMVPAFVLAQTATSTATPGAGDDPIVLIGMMVKAFQSGAWAVGAGLLLTVVVALGRAFRVLQWIPKKAVPWATAAIAVLTSVGLGLTNDQDWMTIVSTGISVGLVAIGGWETLGKLISGAVKKTASEEPKSE